MTEVIQGVAVISQVSLIQNHLSFKLSTLNSYSPHPRIQPSTQHPVPITYFFDSRLTLHASPFITIFALI